MRKRKIRIYLLIAIFFSLPIAVFATSANKTANESNRKERNYIREGNKLYNSKRFAEAEVEYKKAIQLNANSEVALFNLASSLIRQTGSSDPNSKNNPLQQATSILTNLTKVSKDANILSRSFYDLGNIAFNQEQYEQSIGHYKNALRKNPDDDQARQNLRLAQLKLKDQQKNKDQNKDKDKKDKNKDKDKDKDKQDKKKQDQNKNKDKQNQDQNKQNQDQNKQNKQQQPQSGMSDQNIDQILKAMQNEEKSTQQKVNAQKMKEQENARRKTKNQW